MNKYIAPILTIAIVASLAGVLSIRANVGGSLSSVEQAGIASPGAAVEYYVRSSDGDAALYAYVLSSGKTEKWSGDGKTAGPIRFNQSANICDAPAGSAALSVHCDTVDGNLHLSVVDGDALEAKTVLDTTVDTRALGLSPSAEEGYLIPIAVSNDKSAIYLGLRVESESWVAGLWQLDVATAKVSEVTYVREHRLYQFDINPWAKRLVGVTFVPPEGLGDAAAGPSSLHFVDLTTGGGYASDLADGLLENPMLSDDGTMYAYYQTDADGSSATVIRAIDAGRYDGRSVIGVAKDWFGDTMVFDRGGNLFLYDLKTSVETPLTHETDATVEYLGVAN